MKQLPTSKQDVQTENSKERRNFVLGLTAIIWMVVMFLGYIVLHKPFSPEQLSGFLLSLWQIIAAALIILLAGGLGLSLKIEKAAFSPLVQACLSAALGLGIISIIFYILGATIGINIVIWVIFAAAFFLLHKDIIRWLKLWKNISTLWNDWSWIGKSSLIAIVIILVCQLIVALAPPLEFDALSYHLAIPKMYLLQSKITYLPNTMFWGMPQQTESLYTLGMYLGGTEAATVLGWMIGVLTLAGLADLSRQMFGGDSAWVATGSLISGYGIVTLLGNGYVEWTGMLYGLATAISLVTWLQKKETYTLILAGIFAGMALGTKYTSGIVPIAGAIGIFIVTFQALPIKKVFSSLTIFGLSAFLITLPWLIKNALATGNPFYPLVFPAGAMDSTRLAFYNFAPKTNDWTRILLIPWQATFWGVDQQDGFGTSIGPLLIGLSPLALIGWKKFSRDQRNAIILMTTIMVTTFLAWAISSQFRGLLTQTRLFLATFPAWAFLCAAGFAAISELRAFNIRFWNIAGALVIFSLGSTAFAGVNQNISTGTFSTVLQLNSHQTFLENNLGEYERAVQGINALPNGSHVLMLWEPREFECLPKCDGDEIIDRWYHDWRQSQNIDQLIKTWHAEGYTHVLLFKAGADFVQKYDSQMFDATDWQGLSDLQTRLKLVQNFGDVYYLYDLQQ